jgi:RHS repeat-associated protein
VSRRIEVLALGVLIGLFAPRVEAQDLHRMLERLEDARGRIAKGQNVGAEVSSVRALFAARVARLSSKLDAAESRLRERGMALDRVMAARAAFEVSHGSLLESLSRLASEPSVTGIEECLEALRPLAEAESEDVMGQEVLPLSAPSLDAPPLDRSEARFLEAEGSPAAPVIGTVPEAVQELARTVDGPVAAYELVKNQTRFELYFGSMKGAVETLREGGGNDSDVNQLLVQLLRAEGVPARYVRGVVRLAIDQAMSLLGVERAERVEQALTAAGVPYEPVLSGSGVSGIELEHVWAEAYVSWSNYRGVALDDRGKRWVPLDASFARGSVVEGERVLEAMGFDAEAFLREQLAADPASDPFAVLRLRVTEHLEQNFPGTSFEGALRSIEEGPEVFGLLPASLPYEVVSVNQVSFDFPEDLEHRIRFIATTRQGVVVLGNSFPLSRLLGKRLTLSYIAAGPEDLETADAFGGIYRTPPFLIDVRPVLRSGGLVVETGNPVPMGSSFTLATEISTPSGVVRVDNRMIAGAYAAFGLSGGTPGYEEPSESRAGELLNQRALLYLRRWNAVDAALAGLTRSVVFQPVVNHVLVKNHVAVDYASGDVPLTFEWKGIDVDADLRPSVPIPAAEEEGPRRDFYLLSGLIGSDLEARVLEDDLGVESISTVKLLRLGGAVKEIDSSNADAEIPLLRIEADLVSRIEEHVHRGRVVLVPEADVNFLAWTGAGFAAWDPASGESAYMLSGNIAGATTGEPPDQLPNLQDILSDPDESTDEPSRIVAAVTKLPETDFQDALVDRELPLPIGVYVTDADGNPVADGVPVTFRIVNGGDLLTLDRLEHGGAITVQTENGIARLRYQLGLTTRNDPRFVLENSGDRFLTQVGLYHVTAEAGGVALDQPFFAYAFPDAAEENGVRHGRLALVTGRHASSFVLNVPPESMWVETVDRFDNPVSNLEVEFEVLEPVRDKAPLPDDFENATIFDESGAEVSSARFVTTRFGQAVFMRLGNVDATRYRISASREDSLYPTEPIEFHRDSRDFGSTIVKRPIGEKLVVTSRQNGVSLSGGGSLWIGKVGRKLPEKVEYTLVAIQEDYKVVQNASGKNELEGLGTFTRRDIVDGSVTPFLSKGDGRFEPATREGATGGVYELDLVLGEAPGERRISDKVEVTLRTPWVNPDDAGDIRMIETKVTGSSNLSSPVWGVELAIVGQKTNPFVLDGNGHLSPGSEIQYRILPLELDAILTAASARVIEIRKNMELFALGDLPSGPLVLSTINGYDPDKVYTASIALLPGTVSEVRSDPYRLELFNAFLTKTHPAPVLIREVPDPKPDDLNKTKFVTPKDADLEYFVRQTALPLTAARVELFDVDRENGEVRRLGSLPGDQLQGDGKAVLLEGFEPDLSKKEYRAELVLDLQTGPVLRSRPRAVVFSELIYDVSDPIRVTFDVPSAGPACFRPEPIRYHLTRDSNVEIFIQRFEEGANPAARAVPVSERSVSNGPQLATDGVNPITFFPGPLDFVEADDLYRFRIVAKATDDSELEGEGSGTIRVATTGHNVLPVGHTFVKGVDLLDGHLVSSSTDVSIPGRGPALELVRTYGSVGHDSSGLVGAGWSMNYFSTLVITDCGWTIRGGDGSGQSFTRVGDEFVPQKGYHTELVQNDDGSFDFFTKGRIRYHYKDVALFGGEPLYGGRPTLDFIEDPNGNKIRIGYDAQRHITSATEVFAGGTSGRALSFSYATVRGEPRLARVEGPLGLEVAYEYDEWGNLVKATRGERVERYEYSVDNPLDPHNLVAYTDANGNVTRYEYFADGEAFPGETPDTLAAGEGKFEWVKRVHEPEGATTELFYDITEINAGFFNTSVTDARGNVTRYKLNLNGSPVRVEEPKGVVTTMVWAADDIFKTQETDAKLRVTDFRYDPKANLIEETVHAGGAVGDVVTEFEYHAVFNKMTRKRVHNDGGVQETVFLINDANGNLERVTDAEGNETEYVYEANGDLELVSGPRPGQSTSFTYDGFGNPFETTDGEGNVTTTIYDERSRLTTSNDTLGRSVAQDFDELDRVVRVTRTDGSGASETEVIERDYYPGGQLLFESNGLGLRTDFGLDGLNRVVRTEDSLGNVGAMDYDGNGNLIGKTDRRGVVTTNLYDELNRLVQVDVSGPHGSRQTVTEMDYDAVGNKLFEIDLHGSRTDFEYDELYRVKKRLLPTNDEETFTYDRVGNKLTQTDANQKRTRFGYDGLNRLVEREDADGNRVELDYDEAGNQTLERDVSRGLETTTVHDFLNRPLTRVVLGAAPNGFRHETRWEYLDSAHKVVETDPRGFVRTIFLDGFDRVREVRQDTGAEELITFSFYDGNGNLKRTEDAERRTTRSTYDGLNRLREVEDALGQLTRFDYDGEGNKTEEVDRRGVPRRFAYDNLGRLVESELEQILTGKGTLFLSRVFYLDAVRHRIETDARGFQTTYEMDRRGRVTRIQDAAGEEQTFEYDGVNKAAEVDKRGQRTEFTYDAINRLTALRDALGQRATTVYLDELRQMFETDKRGLEKRSELDALGRLVSVTRSGVRLEEHEYDPNNNRTLSTDANRNQTRFVYDGANRLTSRTDALAATTRFTYDRVGNLLEEKDGRPTGKTFDVKNTYDELNRLETSEDGEGNVTSYEYDPDGNRTAVIEPKGLAHRTEYDYGELNELLQVRMPDGGVYSYDYDAARNRIEQRDGENHVVRFTYDRLNRMERMIQDPFNYVTLHAYDPNGNEIQLTDPKGQVITFNYDELNRLKSKVYSLTAPDLALFTRTHRIDYDYDPNDNLVRVDETKSSGTDPPAVVSSFKTYDELDRLETETDAWGRRLTYDYDPVGNRTLLIDPDGKQTVYAYDELNRLETLTLDDQQAVTYEYFPDGLKKTVTNPNGTTSSYLYDAADRMTEISHTGPSGVVSSYHYKYDASSNRERQVETNAGRTETTEYTYDLVNRLKTVTYPDRVVVYEHDQAGNRTREVTSGAEASDETFHYDAINRLERITDNLGGEDVVYSYDANGNTTEKTASGVTTTFHYDIRDQLGEVRQGANILGRYGYDYNGRRILKIGDDGRRQYTYDQLSVITEADQVNSTVSKYDYGMDQLVRLDNRGEGRSFFHLDFLGSTVGLTDAAGSARQSIFYDAWGNERDRIGSSANNFTFTGHELDEETGLIYAKARFYDAEVGRFLSQDSFLGNVNEPPSLHRYFYAHENPLSFVDRTGNQSTWPMYFAFGHYRDNPVFQGVQSFAEGVESTLQAGERSVGSLYGTGKFVVGSAVSTVKGAGHLALGGTFGYEPSIEAGKEFLDAAESFLRHPISTTKEAYHRSLNEAQAAIEQGDHFKAGEVFTEQFVAPNATAVVSAGSGATSLVRRFAGAGRSTVAESVVVGEAASGAPRGGVITESATGVAVDSVKSTVPAVAPSSAAAEASTGRLTYYHQLKTGKSTNVPDLEGQIRAQVGVMNQIVEREGIAGLQRRILEYRADPTIEAAGRAHVKDLGPAGCTECGDPLAWLHGPDMGVGGGPTDVIGKGLLRNNSILGGQANRIANEILTMPSTTKRIDWELVLKQTRVRAEQ